MSKNRWRLSIAALFLLALVIYLRALHAPFLYDDIDQILLNSRLHRPDYWMSVLSSEGLRASRVLQNLSFAANWAISGPDPWSYHVLNIGLHLANGVLLLAFLARVIPGRRFVQFLALSLFLLHPLQIQGVTYVMGRVSLLECMAFLAALNFRAEGTKSRWKLGIVLLLAPWAKETGILVPLVLVLYDLTFGKEKISEILSRRHALYLLPLVTAPLWMFRMQGHSAYHLVVGFDLFPPGRYFLTQMNYLLLWIRLIVLPSGQSLIHEYPLFSPGVIAGGVAGVCALMSGAWLTFRNRERFPELAFFFGFFVTTMASTNTVFQMINPFAGYRLYCPDIAIFFGIAVLLERLAALIALPLAAWAIVGSVLAFTAGFNLQEEGYWSDPVQLLKHSIALYPHSHTLYLMLGGAYEEHRSYGDAEQAYREAERLNRLYGQHRTLRPNILLVQLYEREGLWEKALQEIESMPAGRFAPFPPLSYYRNYLFILRMLGRTEHVRKVLSEALRFYSWEELTGGGR